MLIVVLAVVNLALGVGLALLHDRLFTPRVAVVVEAPVVSDVPLCDEAPPLVDASAPAPSPTRDGELPEHWRNMLAAFSLNNLGIVEAAQWVCVRQCEEARQQLTRAETLQRELQGDDALPAHELDRLMRACHSWCDDLREAIRQVNNCKEATPSERRFDETLADYVSQLSSDLAALGQHDASAVTWANSRRREALQRVLDTSYRLRDELYEHLSVELQARQRVRDVAAHLRVDPEMAVYNRIGLEYLMTSYRQTYDESRGPTSVALIDVDRFRRIQQDLGAAQSDALLAVFAEMAERALRHNRGFDRAARISGHSFAFFLGYTALAGAEMVCERLRQQIEAASFVIGGRELELTVSCSAIELQPSETMSQALKRLRAGLGESRKAGRNRTCLDDGRQQTIVQPTQIQVTGQTIEVPPPKLA
jgi:diguanylate cyclase (GGDEF)-like protein